MPKSSFLFLPVVILIFLFPSKVFPQDGHVDSGDSYSVFRNVPFEWKQESENSEIYHRLFSEGTTKEEFLNFLGYPDEKKK